MASDQGRARKKAIRARMAVSGEAYSVAARKLDASSPARDTAVRDVIARANATLAAPSARFEYRREMDVPVRERREQPRPGPVGRLVRRAARLLWGRLSPEVDAAQLGEMFREAFLHWSGEGFLEPAADRYQVGYGAYTQMYFDGQFWGGPPCRTVDVRAGAAALTVWIDDEHVRQIRPEYRGRGGARRSPLHVGGDEPLDRPGHGGGDREREPGKGHHPLGGPGDLDGDILGLMALWG